MNVFLNESNKDSTYRARNSNLPTQSQSPVNHFHTCRTPFLQCGSDGLQYLCIFWKTNRITYLIHNRSSKSYLVCRKKASSYSRETFFSNRFLSFVRQTAKLFMLSLLQSNQDDHQEEPTQRQGGTQIWLSFHSSDQWRNMGPLLDCEAFVSCFPGKHQLFTNETVDKTIADNLGKIAMMFSCGQHEDQCDNNLTECNFFPLRLGKIWLWFPYVVHLEVLLVWSCIIRRFLNTHLVVSGLIIFTLANMCASISTTTRSPDISKICTGDFSSLAACTQLMGSFLNDWPRARQNPGDFSPANRKVPCGWCYSASSAKLTLRRRPT